MALQLAPWLQPPDYLQAIDKGSQFGLGVVKTNQQAWELNQRAQQERAQLQQSWAAKMMANQTAQQDSASRDALAQQQFGLAQQNFSLGQQRNLNTDAHNQALEDISAAGVKQREAAAAATLAQPGIIDIGGKGYDKRTGALVIDATLKERTVNPLSDVQNTQLTGFQDKTAPVVSSAATWWNPATWADKQTNAAPPLSQSDQANMNFLQNRKDAFIRQNQTPTPFPMQTNSLAPAADAWLGEGNTGNNSPQLASPLPLTNSPAAGTMTNTPSSGTALGGYQVGRRYAGKTYLGGDPTDQTSWK